MRGNGSTGVKVTVTDWAAAHAFARPIRLHVFVEEQGVPVALEWDEHDAASEHAVAFDASGAAVGTGRLLPDGHIGRMAVLAAARGQGAGGAILEALMSRARARGMTYVVLNAQTHAAPFYARHGFAARGEVFMEAGIPHVEMRRSLDAAAD
jgi:predicted GNAT family N-acyltransferase